MRHDRPHEDQRHIQQKVLQLNTTASGSLHSHTALCVWLSHQATSHYHCVLFCIVSFRNLTNIEPWWFHSPPLPLCAPSGVQLLWIVITWCYFTWHHKLSNCVHDKTDNVITTVTCHYSTLPLNLQCVFTLLCLGWRGLKAPFDSDDWRYHCRLFPCLKGSLL